MSTVLFFNGYPLGKLQKKFFYFSGPSTKRGWEERGPLRKKKWSLKKNVDTKLEEMTLKKNFFWDFPYISSKF